MAFRPNKTTGEAVAAVKGLYFLKHQDEEPLMLDALDNSNPLSHDWFPVLSLKGTVSVSQDAPSIEKILVDQFDAPIGITTEPGDFTFEAELPSMAEADLVEWLEASNLQKYMGHSIDGKQILGFNLNGEIIKASVMIETATGARIVFTNCQVVLSFMQDDKVFGFRLSGQVLAATKEANKMIFIATEKAYAAPTGITLNKSTTSLAVGAEETLVATVAPETARQKVVWSSSDESKATVDENGKVTAVATASGSSAPKIRATSVDDETVYAECTVTVTAAA